MVEFECDGLDDTQQLPIIIDNDLIDMINVFGERKKKETNMMTEIKV